jgi:hypothetical protein
MIDNFERIAPLLDFKSPDDYYFIQIIKRRKDNPEMTQSTHKVCSFTITSVEKLWKMKDDIVNICKAIKGRAYLNLNKKSFYKSTMFMLTELAKGISCGQLRNDHLFDSASGSVNAPDASKVWILDIDDPEWYDINIVELRDILSKIEPLEKNKILTTIPTKNGCHILTTPFNLASFTALKPEWKDVGIHKNNPTLLYCV